MSIATMNSRLAKARSRRRPFGVDETGLPAIVSIARTWPSPGVSISSAIEAAGSSPLKTLRPETRALKVPNPPGLVPGPVIGTAGAVSIAPPTASRLPVTRFSN